MTETNIHNRVTTSNWYKQFLAVLSLIDNFEWRCLADISILKAATEKLDNVAEKITCYDL